MVGRGHVTENKGEGREDPEQIGKIFTWLGDLTSPAAAPTVGGGEGRVCLPSGRGELGAGSADTLPMSLAAPTPPFTKSASTYGHIQ